MGTRKTDKKFGVMFSVVAVLMVALIVAVMKSGASNVTQPQSAVDTVSCAKDFSKDVNFVTRNSYEKGLAVDNVSYNVWKNVGDIKVPQPDSTGTITVGYGETYEIVAMADGYKYEMATFAVDESCDGPTDKVFYLTELPTSMDSTFDNSKLTGPNADDNRVPIEADLTRNVKGTFNGESKTSTDAIIVIDANKDEFVIDSTLASASQPEEHSSLTDYKSYTFNLGSFDSSADVLANFDVTGDENLVAGDYNISYTIYQFQNGFVDSDSGEYIATPATEHDGTVLLPTFTGNMYFNVE
jgi:hypothetical protein